MIWHNSQTAKEMDGKTCPSFCYLENSERAIVNPARYALTIPTGNMIAYAHPTTPVAMARYWAIFFNLNIISIYLNYTSELGQDIVFLFWLFPIGSIHEVK